VRLARRNGHRGSGRSELSFTPRWLDPLLTTPSRLEAFLLRHGLRLPAGLSLLALLQRPVAVPAQNDLVAEPGRNGVVVPALIPRAARPAAVAGG
jgi:hypothetical protein